MKHVGYAPLSLGKRGFVSASDGYTNRSPQSSHFSDVPADDVAELLTIDLFLPCCMLGIRDGNPWYVFPLRLLSSTLAYW